MTVGYSQSQFRGLISLEPSYLALSERGFALRLPLLIMNH